MPADIFVSRQPIFDGQLRVTAYELHHRTGRLAGIGGTDSRAASLQMLDHTILAIGLDPLIGHRVGLLTIPTSALLSGQITALPADRVVLHLPAPATQESDLVAACGTARRAGFRLAIAARGRAIPDELLELASYVSVDCRGLAADAAATAVTHLARHGAQLYAKHLGSYHDFTAAQAAGFHYFQGPFFAEPELFTTRELAAASHALTRLMAEVHRADLNLDALESLIASDVALSVKLLRYLQSAGLGWRHEVSSIGQALRVLGQRATAKWASLVAMTMLPVAKPPELFTTALIRAQLPEEIGGVALGDDRRPDLFLVGLLSILEALLDQPMARLTQGMALSRETQAALLGETSPLTPYLQIAIAYDQGNWEKVDQIAASLGIRTAALPDAYHRTIQWVAEVSAVKPE